MGCAWSDRLEIRIRCKRPPPVTWHTKPFVLAALSLLLGLRASVLAGQTVEAAPVGGYRFGGELFAFMTNHDVDTDGAPVVGAAVNVALDNGLSFEALVTRQDAHVTAPGGTFDPAVRWRVVVDQWLAGGRQELGTGRARPFLTGLVGLTRCAIDDESEVRFTVSGGGGVKVGLPARLGVRLDGRVFTTFVDGGTGAVACAGGRCLVGLDLHVAWQAEFTAAMVVGF
jgi:hypothetical protein